MWIRQGIKARRSVPHTSGDEPFGSVLPTATVFVFPTPVGMNRQALEHQPVFIRVPHTSGDEP